MADPNSLINTLRANADIDPSEYDDVRLLGWVNDALCQHNRKITFATLPRCEIDLVVYLAWIKTCYARASKATKYFSISGRSGSVNKAEIVSNNLQLVKQLNEDYMVLAKRLGVNPAPEIIVSDFTKFDDSITAMTPTSAHMPPLAVVLSVSNYTGTSLDLSWTEASPRDTFLRYRIFYGTEPGLVDMTTLGNFSSKYPGINESKASLVMTYEEIWRVSTRISDFKDSVDNFFVVLIEDVNGRVSISNEVSMGPTTDPESTTSLRYATFILQGALTPLSNYIQNISFTDKIKVELLNIQLSGAPVGGPAEFIMSTEASGGGEKIQVNIPEGEYVASLANQNVSITGDNAIFISTGNEVNGAADAKVIIGYRLDEKYTSVSFDEEEYRLSVEGSPEHVVIEKLAVPPVNLHEFCFVMDDDGNRYRLSIETEPDIHVLIESES